MNYSLQNISLNKILKSIDKNYRTPEAVFYCCLNGDFTKQNNFINVVGKRGGKAKDINKLLIRKKTKGNYN